MLALIVAVVAAALTLAVAPASANSTRFAATAMSCAACDVPAAAEIPFCAPFVGYSSCRSASWREMDDAARDSFVQLAAAANVSAAAADASSSCGAALRRAECAKRFSVCELGAPQRLCLASCTSAIAANCSAALQPATALAKVQRAFCGDAAASSDLQTAGVADGGQCFAVDYVGPKHSAWVVGFTIAVVFSFFASVGINLQKRALKQSELVAHEQNSAESTPPYRLPLWCLGFFLILAGSILDFVAFGLAPQSLLAPLAALTLVWNMVRQRWWTGSS